MEAPAKPGGTRKTGRGRDFIGRLGTFPPIQFLKKHNPLNRRRRKPTVGFDQPPQEIKRLALPLRPAPPSLSMRLYVRVRPVGEWCGLRLTSAVIASRHVVYSAAAAGGRVLARAQAVISSRVTAIRNTRAVRYCQARVQTLASRISAALEPAVWPATQTAALMQRTVRVRRVLMATVVCEWTAMIGLFILLAALTVSGRTWDRDSVNVCGLILAAVSLCGLALHGWHHRLVAAWQGMELFICNHCGELRNFSPSLPCPTCGTKEPPVFPGQLPEAWTQWRKALSPLAVAGPALWVSMLLFASRLA